MCKRKAVDLFCGAGGLSLGCSWAGIDVALAIDNAPDACKTARANGVARGVMCSSIYDVGAGELQDPDIVVGGPPCQPFTSARSNDPATDQRNLLMEYCRLIEGTMPAALVMEEVEGVDRKDDGRWIAALMESLTALGYRLQRKVLDASAYGVPQTRRRLILVGFRDQAASERFAWPARSKRVVVRDVLRNLAAPDRGNESKAVLVKRPIMRKRVSTILHGRGRPLPLDGFSPTVCATWGGNHTPFIDVLGEYEREHERLTAAYMRAKRANPSLRTPCDAFVQDRSERELSGCPRMG